MPMQKKTFKKATQKDDKLKLEIKEIKTDLKKLKKSKKRMQLLWYRTKKEHAALIKDLDLRLKALRKKTNKTKPIVKKKAKETRGRKTRLLKK